MHIFLGRAADLTSYEISSLYELEQTCLIRLSTLNRTPVHHLLEHNMHFSADLFDALHKCDSKFLLRLDRQYSTPLDRYFKRNSKPKLELHDKVVFFLCSQRGSWGMCALAHSTEAYRSHSTKFSSKSGSESFTQEELVASAVTNEPSNDHHAELPERFRKFLTGSQTSSSLAPLGSLKDLFAS